MNRSSRFGCPSVDWMIVDHNKKSYGWQDKNQCSLNGTHSAAWVNNSTLPHLGFLIDEPITKTRQCVTVGVGIKIFEYMNATNAWHMHKVQRSGAIDLTFELSMAHKSVERVWNWSSNWQSSNPNPQHWVTLNQNDKYAHSWSKKLVEWSQLNQKPWTISWHHILHWQAKLWKHNKRENGVRQGGIQFWLCQSAEKDVQKTLHH